MSENKIYIEEIRKYTELLSKIDAETLKLEELEKQAKAMQRKIIADMISDGINSVEVVGIGDVKISESRHPSVKNQEELFEFLRADNQGHVIKSVTTESIHSSTFKKINNLYYEEHGRDLPGVESYEKTQLKIKEPKS